MLRTETRGRARALQLLYAWELTGELPIREIAGGVARLTGPEPLVLDFAEALAERVVSRVGEIDRIAAEASDNWRMSRIAVVERNILRIAIEELSDASLPPRVVIDEAVKLAHWFGGVRAPGFVNGVLDRVARSLGRL
ncbi:MAG TPA: transcription antitermination factor NusB [Gemmatimonadales bacterium]|nr:transcription antitermination factor NusB [Gemmatimonadales bacterium]